MVAVGLGGGRADVLCYSAAAGWGPLEEVGGGSAILLKRGAYAGFDVGTEGRMNLSELGGKLARDLLEGGIGRAAGGP